MSVPIWSGGVVAVLFGCAAFLAVQAGTALCERIEPFADGPQPGRPPTPWLIGGAAAIGGALALRGATLPELAVGGILIAALVAAWYCDVRTGIVPDYFTLLPLAIFLAIALLLHDYGRLVAAAGVTLPFLGAALLSRGRGMGWADVKLAALGGMALGWQVSIAAFAFACAVAAAVAILRRRKTEPIAFAPYLAAAIGLALGFNPV